MHPPRYTADVAGWLLEVLQSVGTVDHDFPVRQVARYFGPQFSVCGDDGMPTFLLTELRHRSPCNPGSARVFCPTMKLNRSAYHLIAGAIYLAKQRPGAIIGGAEMAKVLDLPPTYARHQLRLLVKAGVLRTRKSHHGGFGLARPANKITLLELIEAASGPIEGNSLLENEPLETALRLLAAAERKVLSGVTLADLLE